MLPDGFEWRPHFDGHALYLGDEMVATYTAYPGAPYALAYFHCGKINYGGRTYAPGVVRAYVEGWARKWQVELRQEYGA